MKPPRTAATSLAKGLALCALACADAGAQHAAGATAFWLAPPDVTDLHAAPGGEPLYLFCAATGAATTLTIDQPANGAFVPIVATIAADDFRRIDLTPFKAQLETRPTNTIANTGLRITSTAPVTCHYEVGNPSNAEIFTLKGPEALGREFYIPLHRHAPFANDASYAPPHQAFASFDIVATENATEVTIYSPVPIDGHPPLQQFTLSLNRGQTYSGGWTGANWSLPSTHPGGAVVIANKPVAVSLKDDSIASATGGCRDLVGDQIVPVGLLGQDYVAIKGSLNAGSDESLLVMATRNNTQLFLDGAATPVATLFAGEPYRIDMDHLAAAPQKALHLHASAPVYAIHYSGFGCEMASAQLPPLDRGGVRQVDVVRSNSETLSLMITAPAGIVDAFSVSGTGTATIPAAAFIDVPGTGGAWRAARVLLNTTQFPELSTLRVANTAGHFALGLLGGGSASGARYGYYSNFRAAGGFVVTTDAMPASLPEPGGDVDFDVSVRNKSPVPATLTSLVDDRHGDLDGRGDCMLPQFIAAGATYACGYTVSVTDNAGAMLLHTTTATGTQLDAPLIASDSGAITITDVLPGVSVQKTASPALVDAPGGTVTFTARITNTSLAEPILLTSLVDDIHGNLAARGSCALPQTIAPDTTYECSFDALVTGTSGDIEVDTITATVSDDESNTADDQDSASVRIGVAVFDDGFE
jgi:hypothetical protein